MQPLISVEHESRQNANRVEEAQAELAPTEHTLLLRFPQSDATHRNRTTIFMVALLLIVLLVGVFIGVYLLTLQSESENILPPIEYPPKLVKRSLLEPQLRNEVADISALSKVKYVIVVQTDSHQCFNITSCAELLKNLQSSNNGILPYNFMVSSGGQTFRVLGWDKESPMFPQYSYSALVLAFIGNFTDVSPNRNQIDKAKELLAEATSRQYLDPSFVIQGEKTKFSPTALFHAMEEFPQWIKSTPLNY